LGNLCPAQQLLRLSRRQQGNGLGSAGGFGLATFTAIAALAAKGPRTAHQAEDPKRSAKPKLDLLGPISSSGEEIATTHAAALQSFNVGQANGMAAFSATHPAACTLLRAASKQLPRSTANTLAYVIDPATPETLVARLTILAPI